MNHTKRTIARAPAPIKTAVAATLFSLCSSFAAVAADTVIFAKAAPWGIIDAQIQFGLELGFFKEENLDPQFVVVRGGYAAIQQILSGAAQTGYVGTESIPISMQPGTAQIPLRMVYNYFRSPIAELVVLKDSAISTLSDLKGKTIGVSALASGGVPILKAALNASGVKEGDYRLQAVGIGAQATQAFTSKVVDALNLWHTAHAEIKEAGVDNRKIPYPSEFNNIPNTGLAFTETYIKERPDVVSRYGRAMTKSTVACHANPESCIRALWRAHPNLKPAGDDAAVTAAAVRVMSVNFKPLLHFKNSNEQFGAYDSEDWKLLIKTFQTGGMITNPDLPLEQIYTNQFVSEYNNFDRTKVEALAKAAK